MSTIRTLTAARRFFSQQKSVSNTLIKHSESDYLLVRDDNKVFKVCGYNTATPVYMTGIVIEQTEIEEIAHGIEDPNHMYWAYMKEAEQAEFLQVLPAASQTLTLSAQQQAARSDLISLGQLRPSLDLNVYLDILNHIKPLVMAELTLLATDTTRAERFAKIYASKLALVFNNKLLALQYLEKSKNSAPHIEQAITHACKFHMPYCYSWDIKVWREIINHRKNKPSTPNDLIFSLLAKAKVIDTQAFKMREKLAANTPISSLQDYLIYAEYPKASKNIIAARLFAKYKFTNIAFEQYLQLTPKDDDKLIPNIVIEGASIDASYHELTLKKLSPSDPRAAVLGELTSNCQSLENNGKSCVIDGITNKYSGFYILVQKSKNAREERVVAQTWARRENKKMLFDSIEVNSLFAENNDYLVNDFFMCLADKLVAEHNIETVHVGRRALTPDNLQFIPATRLLHKNSHLYSDAKEHQIVIADYRMQNIIYALYCNMNPQAKYRKSLLAYQAHDLNALLALLDTDEVTRATLLENLHFALPEIMEELDSKISLMDAWHRLHLSELKANMKTLIKLGVNVDMNLFASTKNALAQYADAGNVELVEFLLNHGASVHHCDDDGNTALHYAACNTHTNVMKVLLAHGASINQKGRDGNTAFHLAMSYAKPATLQHITSFFLLAGANYRIKNAQGKTVLDLTQERKYFGVVSMMKQKSLVPHSLFQISQNTTDAMISEHRRRLD